MNVLAMWASVRLFCGGTGLRQAPAPRILRAMLRVLARVLALCGALSLAACTGLVPVATPRGLDSPGDSAEPTLPAAGSGPGSSSSAIPFIPADDPDLAVAPAAFSGPEPSAAPSPSPVATRLPTASRIDHGPRDRRVVALTFDADMTTGMLARLRSGAVASWYDARIAETLRATDTAATIFLTGLWAQAYPDVVRSLAADRRFELENHSFDHAGWRVPCYGLPTIGTDDARRAEVTRAIDAITPLAGSGPIFFRFPGGCQAPSDLALVTGLGEQAIGWDVVSGDAFQSDANVVVRNVMAGVQPGSIVVMHFMGAPNAPATAAALERLLPMLKSQGYGFVTLRDLLGWP